MRFTIHAHCFFFSLLFHDLWKHFTIISRILGHQQKDWQDFICSGRINVQPFHLHTHTHTHISGMLIPLSTILSRLMDRSAGKGQTWLGTQHKTPVPWMNLHRPENTRPAAGFEEISLAIHRAHQRIRLREGGVKYQPMVITYTGWNSESCHH